MDLHVCIKIDDDAVDKIAKVITETVKRVADIQQSVMPQQPIRKDGGNTAPPQNPATPYSAQIAQATQQPVSVMTGQAVPVQQSIMSPAAPVSVQSGAPQPSVIPQPGQVSQPIAPAQQQAAIPTASHNYTLDELASAAMLLMDRGMQAQLQELLAGYGVEALPMLPPEQYGNFATALRGMGAQI